MRFKHKKTRKKRGSTFHGWGRGASHHKGAGNRGGRGRAGTGKKADQKKPSFWGEEVGKHGFTSKSRFKSLAINISEVQADIERWIEKGYASKKDKGYELDLKKAGYGKLLGTGDVSVPLFVSCDFASAGAVEKIKAAGGNVTILKVKTKKEKKKPADKPAKKADSKKGAKEDDSEE
jgi:large subunit ribosomal protein L15